MARRDGMGAQPTAYLLATKQQELKDHPSWARVGPGIRSIVAVAFVNATFLADVADCLIVYGVGSALNKIRSQVEMGDHRSETAPADPPANLR